MDEQLYIMGMGMSLEEKIEKAILNIQNYEPESLRRDPDGYYLCDSYGKDSCVILDLAKRSGVKFKAHHNLTTIDPPELIRFGKVNHQDTIIHRPKMHMLTMMTRKNNGPPTRLARWCCSEYKETAGNDKIKVMGIRAAESARRKAQWRVWTPNRANDSFFLNPILFWSDMDVWQYLKQNKIPYCELYDQGYHRLGCIGCPMSGDSRKRDFKRWPKYEQMWKAAFAKFWELHHGTLTLKNQTRWFDKPRKNGVAWTRWEDMWEWWMEEKEEIDEGCQMGLF